MILKRYILLVAATLLLAGCFRGRKPLDMGDFVPSYEPRYATGFTLLSSPTMKSRMLHVRNPWQGAEGFDQLALVLAEGEQAPEWFEGCVVEGAAERIVVMSSSYVAMLDAVGCADRIVGVSGLRYVMNEQVRRAAEQGRVKEVGHEANLNFELIRALKADLVLLYGVSGELRSVTDKLKALDIPYLYIGDYTEEEPLGKSEWLVALAALCGREEAGHAAFAEIERDYRAMQQRAEALRRENPSPTVMLNVPYQDVWYMPSVDSYMVRLIEAAGGSYLYPQNDTGRSLPISTEQAMLLARRADVWLNVGQFTSLDELRRACPKFAKASSVTGGRVYNNNLRRGPHGGSDFWESGAVYPSRILADLMAIFYPSAEHGELYYYRHLK